MAKKQFTIHVSGSDETMWDIAKELGFEEGTKAHGMFTHGADEFKLTCETDTETGVVVVIMIDDTPVGTEDHGIDNDEGRTGYTVWD